jgi:hypothetical protein
MTIGGSLFLIAVGAILAFAVTAEVAGIDLNTVGWILMIVGVIGLVLGLVMMNRARSTGPPPPPGY